jgi:hypothetical protein
MHIWLREGFLVTGAEESLLTYQNIRAGIVSRRLPRVVRGVIRGALSLQVSRMETTYLQTKRRNWNML